MVSVETFAWDVGRARLLKFGQLVSSLAHCLIVDDASDVDYDIGNVASSSKLWPKPQELCLHPLLSIPLIVGFEWALAVPASATSIRPSSGPSSTSLPSQGFFRFYFSRALLELVRIPHNDAEYPHIVCRLNAESSNNSRLIVEEQDR